MVNRIQVKIFEKLADENGVGLEEYLRVSSPEYIGRVVTVLTEITEEEADGWITRAYLKSLG